MREGRGGDEGMRGRRLTSKTTTVFSAQRIRAWESALWAMWL